MSIEVGTDFRIKKACDVINLYGSVYVASVIDGDVINLELLKFKKNLFKKGLSCIK